MTYDHIERDYIERGYRGYETDGASLIEGAIEALYEDGPEPGAYAERAKYQAACTRWLVKRHYSPPVAAEAARWHVDDVWTLVDISGASDLMD